MMIASIQFGSKQIDYQIEYSDRKTLGITVTPDMDVLVKAPKDSPIAKIEEKLQKKARLDKLNNKVSSWPIILKQLKGTISQEKHIYISADNTYLKWKKKK